MGMNVADIIKLITISTEVVETVTKLVKDTSDVLAEDDLENVEQALLELQHTNDDSFRRIKQKLQEAKSRSK